MTYFLIGFGVGSLIAAAINRKFRSGPRWINTKILFVIGSLATAAGLYLEIWQ